MLRSASSASSASSAAQRWLALAQTHRVALALGTVLLITVTMLAYRPAPGHAEGSARAAAAPPQHSLFTSDLSLPTGDAPRGGERARRTSTAPPSSATRATAPTASPGPTPPSGAPPATATAPTRTSEVEAELEASTHLINSLASSQKLLKGEAEKLKAALDTQKEVYAKERAMRADDESLVATLLAALDERGHEVKTLREQRDALHERAEDAFAELARAKEAFQAAQGEVETCRADTERLVRMSEANALEAVKGKAGIDVLLPLAAVERLSHTIPGGHKMREFFLTGEAPVHAADTTLVTWCRGKDFKARMPAIAARYIGPVSVAVWVEQPSVEIPILIEARNSHDLVRSNVDVHVVVAARGAGGGVPLALLLNAAWNHARSDMVFVLRDAAFLPSPGLVDMFTKFRARFHTAEEAAWVVAAFEFARRVDDAGALPNTKQGCVALFADDAIRAPLGAECVFAHEPTMYSAWFAKDYDYEVEYELMYEPLLVLPRSAPRYNTRFGEHGLVAAAHTLELVAAGYELHVLPDEFVVRAAPTAPRWKAAPQPLAPWLAFGDVVKQVETKYDVEVELPSWLAGYLQQEGLAGVVAWLAEGAARPKLEERKEEEEEKKKKAVEEERKKEEVVVAEEEKTQAAAMDDAKEKVAERGVGGTREAAAKENDPNVVRVTGSKGEHGSMAAYKASKGLLQTDAEREAEDERHARLQREAEERRLRRERVMQDQVKDQIDRVQRQFVEAATAQRAATEDEKKVSEIDDLLGGGMDVLDKDLSVNV